MSLNEENDKLDWMYKGANSLVNREEYLLGKSVDKSLEQLNNEEKEKKLGIIPPKNHVEHECIPPSIRDFNKIVKENQVDLSAKLQEDPLVAIKKQEEEARRQFLQNPIQLKKLQDALKAQENRKKSKKRKKRRESYDSDEELDKKITDKLKKLKKSKKKDDLDTILMHKFNQFKDRLTQQDFDDIMAGKSDDDDDDDDDYKSRKAKKSKDKKKSRRTHSSDNDDDDDKVTNLDKMIIEKLRMLRDSTSNKEEEEVEYKQYDSDNDEYVIKKKSFGLVSSDGKKIPLKTHPIPTPPKSTRKPIPTTSKQVYKKPQHKLSDKEKEELRKQMLVDAVKRDKERSDNLYKYRKEKEREDNDNKDFDKNFVHKQLTKSQNNIKDIGSGIRSNLNNIQRSSHHMNSNFSKRS